MLNKNLEMLFKKGRKGKMASGSIPFSASISTAAAACNLSTSTSNFLIL
jgi:hypothetical protein